MNISKLRHRTTIEFNSGTANDGGGNKIPVWEPIAETWANIRPLRGEEVVVANQTGQEVTHEVTMRYRADFVKDKHRFNYKGRILAIESIVNVEERNIELKITCREE